MDSDLVHAPGVGPAQHHAAHTVEAESLELRVALLAPGPGHPAHPDLVADHLDALAALDEAPDKRELCDVCRIEWLLVMQVPILHCLTAP